MLNMSALYKKVVSSISNNKTVIENYFFMTVLQVLNSLFYLIIYPFLIRTLGSESYGLYIFAMSIVTYFIIFVSFGFDMPAVKIIAENIDNKVVKSQTLSGVFSAKIYLELIATAIFTLLVVCIPALKANWMIYSFCFIQTISNIFFPQWYYQGIQKMKIITFIQLSFKILSLPLIFILIKSPKDLSTFVLITSSITLFAAICSHLLILWKEKIPIKLLSFSATKHWYKTSMPFFLTSSTSVIKEQSITVIIGIFLGMKDCAFYDLANKIVMVPRTLLMSMNAAIFPKIITNIKTKVVKKIVNYEAIIGISVFLLMLLFGKWIVLFMGGAAMVSSFPLAVILSITILSWLVVGAYSNFIFIPNNKNYFITKNQFVAFISFFIYTTIGLLCAKNALVLVISITLSGLTEILYCNYLIRKHKLL
jgi:polysaccharide transporter, PST family